jgi:hypothetical protein
MSLFYVHRKRRTRRRRCSTTRKRFVATDVGVQSHEEEVVGIDAEADDDTIKAPAFRRRDTRKGHFVLPPSTPAQSEARVLIISVGERYSRLGIFVLTYLLILLYIKYMT